MIVSGNLNGDVPTGPGYLAWLAGKGFTQAQFTASGFARGRLSDSGVDNGTTTPNHFGFYTGGRHRAPAASPTPASRGRRAARARQGCDGHGNLNAHIIGGFTTRRARPSTRRAGLPLRPGRGALREAGLLRHLRSEPSPTRTTRTSSRAPTATAMRISSATAGAPHQHATTSDAQQYDALVRDAAVRPLRARRPGNQEMVIVFAAGNDGSGANTVAPPGTAKNVITVGASENVQAFGGADRCGVTDAEADSATTSRPSPAAARPRTAARSRTSWPPARTSPAAWPGRRPARQPAGQRQRQALSCFDATGVCGGPRQLQLLPGRPAVVHGLVRYQPLDAGRGRRRGAASASTSSTRRCPPPSAAMTKAYLMNSPAT